MNKLGLNNVGLSVTILGIVYFIAEAAGSAAEAVNNGAQTLNLAELALSAYEGIAVIIFGICIMLLQKIRKGMAEKEKGKDKK